MLDKSLFKKIVGASAAGIEIETTYPMYEKENVLFDVFPNLRSRMDEEGLFDVNDLLADFSILGEPGISEVGYLESKNSGYVIMLHHCLRRRYSIFNAFGRIVPYLFGYYLEDRLSSLKIALDLDRIMLSKDWSRFCRREYYYGPKFTNDIPSNKAGQTAYGLNEADKFATNSYETDFYWEDKKDNSFHLEVEELQVTDCENTSEDVLCKYIHTHYDKDKSMFVHIDGAIRKYNVDDYLKRKAGNIKWIEGNKKCCDLSQRIKLFRADGAIPFDVWKSIIASYMEYNSAIDEYFNSK